ncbi:hypothetical protein TNCV_3396101 [Trichonephila clavipes]|nr:hypothetical protein TNCV_3396101 [Trichonephila clavipes]
MRVIVTSHYKEKRGLLVTDLVTLNSQAMSSTPEMATPFPNYHNNEKILSLDKVSVHQSPLYDGSSRAPGLELVKLGPRAHDHNHEATAVTKNYGIILKELIGPS